ncbi:regulator of chromosome condensation 1/beta-lactamase-inhibitor protein II [Lipomyces japonicus]|uniref:regulator of chromosome condensation 1/beta-lactamase-inhibitor protein II n=1 Tax=Lipomyces japonicus TaxID=56871 RepID=UPI0034CF54CF
MAPKRKQLHDEPENSHSAANKRQTRRKISTAAPAPAPAARRGRKRTSVTSSVASNKGSLVSATDSISTTITEPDDKKLETVEETQADDEQVESSLTDVVVVKKPEYAPYKLKKTTAKVINPTPSLKSEPLNVYVFGTGSMAELGLGPEAKTKEVKRPRLNPFLPIDSVSIVDFAVGGAHVVAIDKHGKLWTWGGNDHGVLGRNTSTGEAGLLRDADADDDDDDDGDLNPSESTPAPVEGIPDEVVFVQVAASDNLTVALTNEGRVWTWGTFRCNEGILGFNEHTEFQRTPIQIPIEFPVAQIATGQDHVLALTTTGRVYSWGNGQQFQLGRRVLDRAKMQALHPREFGIKNIKYIASGEFHSFAIDISGNVLTWGLNQYGQCGIPSEGAGEDGAVITSPTYVDGLKDRDIVSIAGGEHHSIALSSSGDAYVFGRIDMHEIGIEKDELPETAVKDQAGHARFLPVPTKLPVDDDEKFKFVACGTHHNIALAQSDGSAWSWGFGETYQVGQGPAGEDVEIPTKIENTATKGVNMVLAGAGGQFSVIGGIPPKQQEEPEKEETLNNKESGKQADESNTENQEGH